MIYKSTGTLSYSLASYGPRLVLDIDRGIADYYRSLIPRHIASNRQAYPPHISVVRKESVPRMKLWGAYEGKEISFDYENIIRFGTVYIWLNCFSVDLEEIRLELGLPVSSPYTEPPEGFKKCFHSTIGNFK